MILIKKSNKINSEQNDFLLPFKKLKKNKIKSSQTVPTGHSISYNINLIWKAKIIFKTANENSFLRYFI